MEMHGKDETQVSYELWNTSCLVLITPTDLSVTCHLYNCLKVRNKEAKWKLSATYSKSNSFSFLSNGNERCDKESLCSSCCADNQTVATLQIVSTDYWLAHCYRSCQFVGNLITARFLLLSGMILLVHSLARDRIPGTFWALEWTLSSFTRQ